jgi:Phycobilisome protein
MNARLNQIMHDANGRYLTAEERDVFLAYADSVPRRFHAADAVAKVEEGAVRAVVEEMTKRYPNYAKYHDQGWAKCFRDVQLVVRQDVRSMLLDDVRSLDDQILLWLRTTLAANNLTPGFCRDAYSLLRDKLKDHLGAEEYDLLRPYLDRNIDVLGDFPEPATPAV